jgi:hypothetical protein
VLCVCGVTGVGCDGRRSHVRVRVHTPDVSSCLTSVITDSEMSVLSRDAKTSAAIVADEDGTEVRVVCGTIAFVGS